MGIAALPLTDRIIRLTTPEPNTGCWLWTAAVTKTGYGLITLSGKKSARAHRVSFRAFCHEIPNGMLVCHHCDVKLCVNPSHLYIGSVLENAQDATARNRYRIRARHGRAKLTENNVSEIRASHKEASVLAQEFDVTSSLIYQIRKNKVWKD